MDTRGHATLSRLVAALLLSMYLLACTSWRVRNVTPERAIARDHPDKVRVTRVDSSRIVLSQPRISGDSLVGFANHLKFGMPLSDVSAVAERRFNVGKSIALGVGIPAGTILLLAVLACSGGGTPYVC
jgi:hypothetical protein